MDSLHQVGGIVEEDGNLLERILQRVHRLLDAGSRDGLDTADTGRNRTLGHNLDHTDVTGIGHVGTATQLDRRPETDYPHLFAVLLAEESHGSHGLGLGNRHVAALVQRNGFAHLAVGQNLYLTQLFVGHLLEVREVEAQRLGRYIRTFLLDMRTQHLAQGLVQQVGGRVVAGRSLAGLLVDNGMELSRHLLGHVLGNVYTQVVFPFRLQNLYRLVGRNQFAGIAYLATHLGIEGGAVEHNLVIFLVFLFYLTVAQDAAVALQHVVAHKLGLALAQHYPVARLYGSGIAGSLFLLLHLGVESVEVYPHALLLEDELGQVDGESVGIVEGKGIYPAYLVLAGSLGIGYHLVEQLDTGLERTQEGIFLLLDYLADEHLLLLQLGIGIAHRLDENIEQLVEEGLFLTQEGVTVTHGPAQDTADYIAGLGIRRQLTVGNREGDGADVVGNHTHGDVNLGVFAVGLAAEAANLLDDGLEHVGIVVRGLALQSHTEAFETHTRIDYPGRQRLERTVGLAVVLHEHEVPDLDYLRVALVHEREAIDLGPLGIATQVDVNFGAGTAGTRIAHFPEVVVTVTVDNVLLGQMSLPVRGSLVVALEPFGSIALEHRSIQAVGIDFEHIDQIFPGPVDGLFLEVVAKRPVAQHLEHGMVIGIETHLFQIVVLAAHAQALL